MEPVAPVVRPLRRIQMSLMTKPKRPHDPQEIRDAGPEAMTDPPPDWDEVDEISDESFPASDPPPPPGKHIT